MEKHYTKGELTKLHNAIVLLALSGLLTDSMKEHAKYKLLKLPLKSKPSKEYLEYQDEMLKSMF
jgi:hypothetical protein